MALTFRCDKHNVEYIILDIYPEWELWVDVPKCPYCRKEWMEVRKDDWDFPEPYEIFKMGTLLALEDCVVHQSHTLTNTVSYEGMSGPCVSDPLLVALAASVRDPWWTRAKRFMEEVLWRIRFALQVLLYGEVSTKRWYLTGLHNTCETGRSVV